MANLFKKAYIKYIDSFDKYLELTLDDGSKVLLYTTVDHFPHLIGKQYIQKYLRVPNSKFISDISSGVIDNQTLYKMDKSPRAILRMKLKAMDKLDTLVKGTIVSKNLSISTNITGDAFIYRIIEKKVILIVLKKDKINLFHPISIMLLDKKSRKFLKIEAEAKKRIVTVSKLKKRPIKKASN